MDKIVDRWHEYVKNVSFTLKDYRETLRGAKSGDFVFLDPPYFGNVSSLYKYDKFNFNDFWDELRRLNGIGAKWILTFNAKSEGVVPKDVYIKYEDHVCVSHFKKLGKKKDYGTGTFGDFFNFECEKESLL